MNIIDLLNKIANGEEVPNKFKLKDWKTDLVFCYNKKYNCYDLIGEKFKSDCYVFGYSELNDKIEILEEEKKIPEKFKINYEIDEENTINMEKATMLECDLACRINEIIDVLEILNDKIK